VEEKIFLLAQRFMPAQEIHVLKNPRSDTPWDEDSIGETLVTPEWEFDRHELREKKQFVLCVTQQERECVCV